jgi:hypothetical protein
MDDLAAFYRVMLRRIYTAFQHITYRGVPICKFNYYSFSWYIMQRWSTWSKANRAYWQDELSQLVDSEVYLWSDEPYHYDPHPGGVVLMQGRLGEYAALHLPQERFVLICPNQAAIDALQTTQPDLLFHNIEDHYRENPKTVETLIEQFAQVVTAHQGDSILGSPDLVQWYTEKMPDIVRSIDAVQYFFDHYPVGAVITVSTISEGIDDALNLIAKANRIPSLTFQHCIIEDTALFCHIPIVATKKLIWGNTTRKWYQKYGFPESRVSVIGSPRFDIIFNRKWRGKEKLCEMLGIDPAKKIMVYATGPDRNTLAPMVLKGLAAISDLFLILKLAPSENSAFSQYQELTKGFANCAVVRYDQLHLYDALSGADLFITNCSTAAIEAMMFNLPVITIEPYPPYFSYGDWGASLRTTDSTELNKIVSRLISDVSFRKQAVDLYQEFLANYCIPDGLATKRLFDEVELLCRTGGIA